MEVLELFKVELQEVVDQVVVEQQVLVVVIMQELQEQEPESDPLVQKWDSFDSHLLHAHAGSQSGSGRYLAHMQMGLDYFQYL